MNNNRVELFRMMFKSRMFEDLVIELWDAGNISGEMHTGRGEEAIIASVISLLEDGDALALDHRGTAPLLMRGVDPKKLLLEFLGHKEGLCGGMGGHMHLFSRTHLAASSGIVGASGPAGAGFALSAKFKRRGKIAVSFFGEGSLNQGMMMESMNLAKCWQLPVLFICKDENRSITENSSTLRGGSIKERADGFGLKYFFGNGLDTGEIYPVAKSAVDYVRSGKGPAFLHATCIHIDGHFLGFQLLRILKKPGRELSKISLPLIRRLLSVTGSSMTERIRGMKEVVKSIIETASDAARKKKNDPIKIAENSLVSEGIDPEPVKKGVLEEISELRDSINRVI